MSGEQAQREEENGCEEEGTTLCTIRPLQSLKGSSPVRCKGLRIDVQQWCGCEGRSFLQQLSLQRGQQLTWTWLNLL